MFGYIMMRELKGMGYSISVKWNFIIWIIFYRT